LRLPSLQRTAERTKLRKQVFEITRQPVLLDSAGLSPAAEFRLVAAPEGIGKILPGAPGDGFRHPPAPGIFVGGFDPDGQAPEARVPSHRRTLLRRPTSGGADRRGRRAGCRGV
jgi:hypothetical protein